MSGVVEKESRVPSSPYSGWDHSQSERERERESPLVSASSSRKGENNLQKYCDDHIRGAARRCFVD